MSEPELVALTQSDALHPRLALFHAQLEDVRANLKKLAGKFGAPSLDRKPIAGFFSPAGLLAHCAETEAWWIQVLLEARREDPEHPLRLPRGWCTPFAEEAGGEARTGGRPLSDYLALLDRTRAHTFALLETLGPEDLTRRFPIRDPDGKDYEFSLEWVLHHLVEHEAHHRGQLALLKRILQV